MKGEVGLEEENRQKECCRDEEEVVVQGTEQIAMEEGVEGSGVSAPGAVDAGEFVEDAGRQPGAFTGCGKEDGSANKNRDDSPEEPFC